jgi:hypothetical protein
MPDFTSKTKQKMHGGVCPFRVVLIAAKRSCPRTIIPIRLSAVRRTANGCAERHITAPRSIMIRHIAPSVGIVKSCGVSNIPSTCEHTANRDLLDDQRCVQNGNNLTSSRSWNAQRTTLLLT